MFVLNIYLTQNIFKFINRVISNCPALWGVPCFRFIITNFFYLILLRKTCPYTNFYKNMLSACFHARSRLWAYCPQLTRLWKVIRNYRRSNCYYMKPSYVIIYYYKIHVVTYYYLPPGLSTSLMGNYTQNSKNLSLTLMCHRRNHLLTFSTIVYSL